jgi:predicted MPP superfamily phosphohydrolase
VPHRLVRRIAICLLVVIAVGPLVLRWVGLDVSRAVGFRLVIVWLIVCTVIWWTLADAALAGRGTGRSIRWFPRVLLGLFVLAMVVPAVQMAWSGRLIGLFAVPAWASGGFQLWHMGLGLTVPVVLAFALLVKGLLGAAHLIRGRSSGAAGPAPGDLVHTRREVLAAAGLYAPLLLVGGLTAAGARQMGRFNVHRYELPAPWLPPRLRGLTVTHVSDLHVGRLYRPHYLPRLVEEVNKLNSDLVLFTGDLVDVSNGMLPPSLTALRQFEPRHGMYLAIGNHDMIDDRRAFIAGVRDAGFTLLLNERRSIEIGGERVCIAGMDWSRSAAFHAGYARRMLEGYDASGEGPCIALAHHPHAFDALAAAGVPLTLSGHTHGGQLMFRPPRPDGVGDRDRDAGAGELLFKYLRGFYRDGPSTLFVNSGVGNWFPVRINAPAEIVQIRLV